MKDGVDLDGWLHRILRWFTCLQTVTSPSSNHQKAWWNQQTDIINDAAANGDYATVFGTINKLLIQCMMQMECRLVQNPESLPIGGSTLTISTTGLTHWVTIMHSMAEIPAQHHLTLTQPLQPPTRFERQLQNSRQGSPQALIGLLRRCYISAVTW